MKILFLGDVVGRAGREAIQKYLPELKKKFFLEYIIVNGENAAGGFGINQKTAEELFSYGVNVITGGNHSWDQPDSMAYIEKQPRLLRPYNFPLNTPGKGVFIGNIRHHKIVIINLLGRLFMEALDDPFAAIDTLLKLYRLGENCDCIFVDFHAETTSEKAAFAYYVDGRVSAVIGTHTHIPTADGRILPKGTAFQTDAGMCGDYDSVIGMDKQAPIQRFTRKMRLLRMQTALKEGTLCGVILDIDPSTGLTTTIQPVRMGGYLSSYIPSQEAVIQEENP